MSEDRGSRASRQRHAPGAPRAAAAATGLAALAALTALAAPAAATAASVATNAVSATNAAAAPTATTLVSRCVRPDGRVEYTDGECAPGERARGLQIELRPVDPQEQQEALRRARDDYERVTRRLDARAVEHSRLAQQRRESARRDSPAIPAQAALPPAWSVVPMYGVPIYGGPVYGAPIYGPPTHRLPGTALPSRPYIGAPMQGVGTPPPVQPGSGVGAVAPTPAPPMRGSYKPG